MTAATLAELRDVAIGYEPDRYFAATLAPGSVRYDLIVLAAFAAELERIPGQVREVMAGEIRLQWWRDALASANGDLAAGHPVATAMRATMARFALPWEIVDRIIDAQADVLYRAPPADEATLRLHMAAGEGGMFRLAARICGSENHAEMASVCDASGLAYGLSRVLTRGSAEGAAWLPIPSSLMPAAEMELGNHGDARANPMLQSALGVLMAMSREAHAEASVALAAISRSERIAFLPLAMVKPNLAVLQTWLSHEGARATEPLPIGRLLRIGWAHASGRL